MGRRPAGDSHRAQNGFPVGDNVPDTTCVTGAFTTTSLIGARPGGEAI